MKDCANCQHYYECNSNSCDNGFVYETTKWFDDNGFMEYMRTEFPEPMKNHFTYNLLKNTINYLIEQFDDNTYLASTISEIVPEITEQEILMFCAK